MNAIWWLVLGALIGWLVELAIDYLYWRKQAKAVAARQAERHVELRQEADRLQARSVALDARDAELTEQKSVQNAKDAELLAQARRLDERAEEHTRLEQRLEKRRAELDKAGLTLNEREREIAGRHEALKALEADAGERMKALTANEQDVARRVAVVSNRESAMSSWETRILAREREVADREALLARDIAEAEATQVGFATLKALVGRQYRHADGRDNLETIAGIEPKIAGLLHDADIRSFERLSETPVGELTRILEAAGPRFGLADPMTWAEQAGLIHAGDFLGFEALKDELQGGVRRADTATATATTAGEANHAANRGESADQDEAAIAGDVATAGDAASAQSADVADVTDSAGATVGGAGQPPSVAGSASLSAQDANWSVPSSRTAGPEALGEVVGVESVSAESAATNSRSDGPLFDAVGERGTGGQPGSR